ncbi:beta-galactosidase [Algibacter lectus]|uniref:Beta-galactosidase n=1 Tax=Algibacter lectus TaxID=221126 RepID=A0A090VL40_9FLAO|nr:beta-galactosidase [Algibacter lectus]
MTLLVCCNSFYAQERTQDFNFNWKFTLVEDTKTPTNLPLDDTKWRDVRLPHDWSVEASFSEDLDGATGYLPGGVGIYQKHFDTPADAESKNVFVLFDGVYNNATFWLNGKLLGENPYGYSPTYFDLTEVLKTDGTKNILTVHVDHSRYVDSRWYTGSGIYRHVKLITVDKLHIPIWGTFVTTPEVSAEVATVQIQTKIKNGYGKNQNVTLITKIIDNQGKTVTLKEKETKIGSGKEIEVLQRLQVANPKLWDTEHPNLYKVITNVSVKGKVIDTYTTPFGIRSLLFDKDKGFFLNGKPTYVKGVCLHHDAGLVGAAVPKGVWERRLQILKEGGVNAIRTSHNPFSEEFLDLCDEMGFLVQNEIFDEMDNPKDKQHNMNEKSVQYITRGYTEHFQKWGESDLKRTMLRDRNHPSVFQWSIGNEIEWTYEAIST